MRSFDSALHAARLPVLVLALLAAACGDDDADAAKKSGGTGGDSPPGTPAGANPNAPGTPGSNAPGNPGVPVSYTCVRDIHVSPSGNDANDGLDAAKPKKTLGAGLKAAKPGDCVKAHEGTYSESKTLNFPSDGTKDAPIVLWSADGRGKAVIDSSSNSGAVFFLDKDFVIIDGFEFKGKATNDEEQVIHMVGNKSGKGLGSAIRNNKITGGHNHLKINDTANGMTIEGNEFYGSFGHIPISLTGASNMVFRKNTGHDWAVGEDAAIQIKGGSHDSVFDSNRFDNVDTLGGVIALGDGCAASCDDDPEHFAGVRLKAINNVIVGAKRAFDVNGCKDCALLNNTSVDMQSPQFGVIIKMVKTTTGGVEKGSTGTRIMNNIFAGKIGQVLDVRSGNEAGLVMDYNLAFTTSGTIDWGRNGTNSHSVTADPMLNPDFSLKAGSPAIGKGNDVLSEVTVDFAGNARTATFDIGAFKAP